MSNKLRNKNLVQTFISLGLAKSQKDLGLLMGYNESYFSQIINGRVAMPEAFADKAKELYPNLNKKWLLNGEGDMMLGQGNTIQTGDINGNGNTIAGGNIEEPKHIVDRLLDELEKATATNLENTKNIAELISQQGVLIALLKQKGE